MAADNGRLSGEAHYVLDGDTAEMLLVVAERVRLRGRRQ